MFLQHSDELKVVVNISAPTLQEAYSVKVDLDNHDDMLLLQVVSPLLLVHPPKYPTKTKKPKTNKSNKKQNKNKTTKQERNENRF